MDKAGVTTVGLSMSRCSEERMTRANYYYDAFPQPKQRTCGS